MPGVCYNCFRDRDTTEGPCPFCGYDSESNTKAFPKALPPGTPLCGIYIVRRTLGQGGFGITYLAEEHQTNRFVAIKEFFPDTMADRNGTNQVIPFTGVRGENFAYGKETFQAEAETLEKLKAVSNIANVYRYFEENGTGYFSMEYIRGDNLTQYVQSHGGKLSYAEAEKLLLPIMSAMSAVHARGIIHRDIKPDNILITEDGIPKLLDFGSARYSLGEKSRSLDVVLTYGFAPEEQYSRRGRQGAFTDVYALAATFYYTVTGRTPPDSIDRKDRDELIAPSTLGVKLTDFQEDALLKGLAVYPEERWQSMEEFRQGLLGNTIVSPPEDSDENTDVVIQNDDAHSPENIVQGGDVQVQNKGNKKPKGLLPLVAVLLTAIVLVAVGFHYFNPNIPEPTPEPEPVPEPELVSKSEPLGNTVEILASGSCGKNVSWELDREGLLTISGSGTMYDFDYSSDDDTVNTEWWDFREEITSVSVENGVTQIGSYAFAFCENLKNVTLGKSVKSIESGAFGVCASLSEIALPSGLEEIASMAFCYCVSLKSIKIPDGVNSIEYATFAGCEKLYSVSIPSSVGFIGSEAFELCSRLSNVQLSENTVYVEDAFDESTVVLGGMKLTNDPGNTGDTGDTEDMGYTESHDTTEERLQYFISHCDSEYFPKNTFEGFDKDSSSLARNAIFAHAGRSFSDNSRLQNYFSQFSWYHPSGTPASFQSSSMNRFETVNLYRILDYETKQGYRSEQYVETYQRLLSFINNCDSRSFSRADLSGFDEDMLTLARNAIYAKSGRRFNSEYLTAYYGECTTWYNPRVSPSDFNDETMLNTYQKQNRDLVIAYEQEQGYR